MALVRGTAPGTYRRFTWMGSDKTETSYENMMLIRDGGEATGGPESKRRTREQRTRVIREVRCYLDHLRKEILQNDQDAELTGMPKSGYKRDISKEKEAEKASMNLSCLVRGASYRNGTGFASPYDGTSHNSLETLTLYNRHCRQTLTNIIAEKIETLKAKKQAGEQLTQREAVAFEEAQTIELPTEEEAGFSGQEWDVLSKPEGEDEDMKRHVREEYAERALGFAKNLLQYNLVRNANLYGSFREDAMAAATSRVSQPDAECNDEEEAPVQEDQADEEQETCETEEENAPEPEADVEAEDNSQE